MVEPSLGNVARVERQVAVGRDVPVIRLGVLPAADAVLRERERQKARFTLIAHGKAKPGQGQNRYVLKAQLCTFSRRDVLVNIEGHFVGPHDPVGLPRLARQSLRGFGALAGAKARVFGNGDALAHKVDAVSRAIGFVF